MAQLVSLEFGMLVVDKVFSVCVCVCVCVCA